MQDIQFKSRTTDTMYINNPYYKYNLPHVQAGFGNDLLQL